MKLIIAIMSNDDSPSVSNALTKQHFTVTRLATTGGFLRAGNTTLLIGTAEERVDEAFALIKEYSSRRTEYIPNVSNYDLGRYASLPTEIQVGGAVVFVIDVEQFITI